MTDVDLAELFATVPTEFVAARNALVKALRADKRRDEATALAGIRRPSWVDWALNAASTAHGDGAATFGAAAAELREAQAAAIEGRDGPDLKASLRGLRDATATFARHASAALVAAGRSPDSGEVAARLGEVAADGATVDQLLAGVLGSSETDGPDLFAGLSPAARSGSGTKQQSARPAKRRAGARPRTANDDESAKAAADAARAAEERAALEAALTAAERDRDDAAAGAAEADDEVVTAEAAEADARAALDAAQHASKDARARQRAAHQALDRLDQAVAAARAALPQ